MHLQPNTTLQGGKYRINRFISSGGFGCTYEATHTLFEETVAIKEFFVKDFCNRDETTAHVTVATQGKQTLVDKLKRKFIEEAKMLYRMQHPGIVHVSDVFEENGTAYFVMDYIDGPSLNDMVKNSNALSEERAVRYIRQVAEALKFVHSKDRLHLDVKPGNIMVDSADNAILIDFGASKQYDEVDGENTSTLLGKTPGYAPLEQMGNDVVTFMPATDIYALGATLYKLLTGVTPLSATLLASGEDLEPLPDTVSEATCNAVLAAMSINKRKRPQTIDEFLAMLPQGKLEGDTHIHANVKTTRNVDEETRISDEETIIIGGEKDATPTDEKKLSHGTCNGHEWVDLGLSVKWATCNVGANSPEESGDYFAWGEINTKDSYIENNYKWKETVKGWMGIKQLRMKDLGRISGNPLYDAANANWGETWRVPTFAELQELMAKCTWTLMVRDGINGYLVTGLNGNRIFLPAAGYYAEILKEANRYTYYWCADSNNEQAYSLSFYQFHRGSLDWLHRFLGLPIRPVTE